MKTDRDLNDILNECLDRLNRGETVAQCLARFPQHADALEHLLNTAFVAHKISVVRPRPEVKAIAKARFLAAVRETEVKKTRRVAWLPGWAAAAATALVVILAGGGTVVASTNSMPDSPLYSVKLATEQVRLTLTFSGEGKTDLYARFADNRVTEIAYMADKGNIRQVELLTSRLDKNLAQLAGPVESNVTNGWLKGFGMASESSTLGGAPTTTATITTTTTTPSVGSLPLEPGAAIMDNSAPPMQAQAPSPNVPAAEGGRKAQSNPYDTAEHSALWSAIERQYADNIALLQAALAKAPEELKLALQHALDVMTAGYRNALQTLD
jgi:hypothetical protein